jgi:LmbE family N-acetylglucosaminyl deacetylase
MRNSILFILINLILLPVICLAQEPKAIEPFNKVDRILILAPHPDDETIACGGVIQQALKAGATVKVAYLTNGDHNQIAFIVYEKRLTFRKGEFIHMGEIRRKEAIKAMKMLGVGEDNLIFLGYPDFGTFRIFSRYWQDCPPYKSFLTRISSVPYKNNPSYGAPYKGESILGDIKSLLIDYKPNKIFVSHPADTNVDHRALYLFLQTALGDLNNQLPQPKIYPYLVHCVGWPKPRHYHPKLSLQPPKSFMDNQINWAELDLNPGQIDKKYRAILCYKSQTESSAFYLLAFSRQNELFGDYPDIELNKQISTREQGVSFFGFSNMFSDSDDGVLGGLENLIEGKGQVSYAVVDNSLFIRIEKSKEFTRTFSLQLYLFGYSYKKPFASMPKIRLVTKNHKFKVFDGKKKIKADYISIDINSNILILKVPLEVLGNPDFILTSIKTYGGVLPFETIAFRKIYIK